MMHSPKHRRFLSQVLLSRILGTASVLALCAGSGFAQTAPVLKSHHAPHVAPASLAPQEQPFTTDPVPAPYSGTPRDVLTYHYDNYRTGWNQTETDLTPSSVASSKFTLLKTLAVDGNVLAQPLLVSGYKLPDGSTHDVLLIATGHNTLYAYDANTFAVLWSVNLGTAQSSNDVGCGDVVPEYGISSTPVVLRNSPNSAVVYLIAATEPTPGQFVSTLHAIDVGTGKDVVTPSVIAPTATLSDGSTVSFDPQNQWSRAGLASYGGAIYVSIGSHCDNNSGGITGWELRYSAATLGLMSAFHTVNSPGGTELASIWMTGFAPAIDPKGNLFVVTGNGDFTKFQKDWGESALRLPASLQGVTAKFTPASYNTLNQNDTDFGSGGIMLLPPVAGQTVPPLAVAIGKSSILYLLDQSKLGGERPNDSGALQSQQVSGNGTWGGPAYYDGPLGPTVFVQTDSDVLRGYSVATTGTPALTQTMSGTTSAGYGGSIPVTASNASAAGVLFLVRRSVPMSLEAYDATKLGAPLYTHDAGVWSNKQNQNSFVAPMEANGRVYAPAYKTVKVFGLSQ